MKNRTFLEDLFQSIGFVAAIMVALSQYFLSSNFESLFRQRPEFFNISNIIAVVLTFSIILGNYTNRHSIDMKIYFNKKKRDEFWEQQRKQNEKQAIDPQEPNLKQTISKQDAHTNINEPWGFTIYQLAYVSLLVCVGIFALLLSSENVFVIAISYVLMICLAVFSLSVFSIKIYTAKEYESRQARIYSETINKINMYFAGKISIKFEYADRTNWMYSVRTTILEHNGKTYLVKTDANNPENYFEINEYAEKVREDKKTS